MLDTQCVAIGLCTRQRPLMLTACLESLFRQAVPAVLAVHIVVVDNEPEPNNQAVVDRLRAMSPFPLHYIHEPRTGIPFARNGVLDKALALGAGWIAFLDDDEIADPQWIASLMAPEYRDTPVLMGHQRLVYPDDAFWAPAPRPPKYAEGQTLSTAYTYNVRFAASIATTHRFNEGIGLGSGSDVDFFNRVASSGADIRFTRKAVTVETVHAERVTFSGQCYRSFRNEYHATRRLVEKKGWAGAMARGALFIPNRLVAAVGYLIAGAACGPVSPRLFKKLVLASGKHVSRGAGFGAALVGFRSQAYSVVHGS